MPDVDGIFRVTKKKNGHLFVSGANRPLSSKGARLWSALNNFSQQLHKKGLKVEQINEYEYTYRGCIQGDGWIYLARAVSAPYCNYRLLLTWKFLDNDMMPTAMSSSPRVRCDVIPKKGKLFNFLCPYDDWYDIYDDEDDENEFDEYKKEIFGKLKQRGYRRLNNQITALCLLQDLASGKLDLKTL